MPSPGQSLLRPWFSLKCNLSLPTWAAEQRPCCNLHQGVFQFWLQPWRARLDHSQQLRSLLLCFWHLLPRPRILIFVIILPCALGLSCFQTIKLVNVMVSELSTLSPKSPNSGV